MNKLVIILIVLSVISLGLFITGHDLFPYVLALILVLALYSLVRELFIRYCVYSLDGIVWCGPIYDANLSQDCEDIQYFHLFDDARDYAEKLCERICVDREHEPLF